MVDLNAVVADFVSEDGEWRLELFQNLIHDSVCQEILNFIPPQLPMIDDSFSWAASQDGSFSTKSAFRSIVECDEGQNSVQHPIWKLIWHWNGPPRAKCFMWKASKGGLMTNEMRMRRGFSNSKLCPICESADESQLHAIRDCVGVKSVWMEILPRSLQTNFFHHSNIADWLVENLCCKSRLGNWANWSLTFGIAVWRLWLERNNRVFNSINRQSHEVMALVRTLVFEVSSLIGVGKNPHRDQQNYKQRLIAWSPPQISGLNAMLMVH